MLYYYRKCTIFLQKPFSYLSDFILQIYALPLGEQLLLRHTCHGRKQRRLGRLQIRQSIRTVANVDKVDIGVFRVTSCWLWHEIVHRERERFVKI